MKNLINKPIGLIPAGLCLACALLANNNATAGLSTWDPQGTTGSTPYTGNMSGTWENASWSTAAGQAAQAVPVNWVENNAAVFAANSGLGTPAFTVTMNANHTVAGIFNGPLNPDPCPVTITGTGIMTVPSGEQGFYVTSNAGDPGSIIINTVMAGSGIITAQGSGTLGLYGVNTLTGGIELGYSGASFNGIVGFNNSASFGTGLINMLNGSGSALVAQGTSAITIPNNFANNTAGATLNVVGNTAGVTFSGPWSLGANALSVGSGGAAGNLVKISGVVSGTAGLTKFNPGILALTAVNTYTGPTTITAGKLQLGIANAVASSSSLIMGGGTLDPAGFHHVMASTTLGLTASSTIDFVAGASELDFANSSGLTWTGVLNLANWNPALDKLRIGTDLTGLTTAQLADIEVNGAYLGTAEINSSGYISFVPEPSTALLGLLGGLGVMWTIRRRTA